MKGVSYTLGNWNLKKWKQGLSVRNHLGINQIKRPSQY